MNNYIKILLSEFNKNNISYVHWKSNLNIDKALVGEDDLDILVSKTDTEKVKNIFKSLKVIRAYSKKDKWQKEIYHYIGCDEIGLKLIHVHLHYSLEVGYDFDKRYNLPIVDNYIKDCFLYKDIVYLPQLEKEYILIVLRLILKNAFIPFILQSPFRQIKTIINQKKGVILGSGYKEFEDLKSNIDRQELSIVLKQMIPSISFDVFKILENILINNNSFTSYIKGARILSKRIDQTKSHNDFISFYKSFIRIIPVKYKILKKIIFKTPKTHSKTPENGGRIIAFIGGDGAGKSTNIQTLYNILSSHFHTRQIHLGRPKRTIIGNFLWYLQRFLKKVGSKNISASIYYFGIAIDRFNTYKEARTLRDKGAIVLLDRIPHKDIIHMDCPRIHHINKHRKFIKWLSAIEKKIYSQIENADLIIVLKLDPKIALERRPEDNAAELLKRSGNVWDQIWNKSDGSVIEIDSSISLKSVQSKVLEHAWNQLNKKFIRYEIIGLPGSGKSTITKKLQFQLKANTNITLKKYPKIFFSVLIFNFPQIISIYFKSKKYKYVLNFILLKITLKLIENSIKLKKNLSSNNYIFDQGPLFQLAMGIKENLWDDFKFQKKSLNLLTEYLDCVIYLGAPDEVLWKRVKEREQSHQLKEGEYKVFIEFCQNYQEIFSRIKNNNSFKTITYDTSNNSIEKIINEISLIK
jgi:thymidylate kinase